MEGDSEPKPKKARSASYPAVDLETAIQKIQEIKTSLGHGQFSREAAGKAMGYSGISGKSSAQVAALVQYGLLDRQNDTYRVSDLAYQILVFTDQSERSMAIASAAASPKLFKKLLDAYSGHGLPTMLSHILARQHGINEKVAPQVVKTFVATMTYAGLLENGVLRSEANVSENGTEPSTFTETPAPSTMAVAELPNTRVTNNPLASTAVQQVPIVDGVVLCYPPDLAFTLMTNQKFTTALKDMKEALQPATLETDHEGSDGHDN